MYHSLAEAAANCARNIATGYGPICSDRKKLGGAAVLMPQEPEDDLFACLNEESADAEQQAAVLEKALKSSYAHVRAKAVCALAKLVPPSKQAVPAMLEALEDCDWVVKVAAITALGELGGTARDAVPALIEALDREDVCASATIALGRIGPSAKAALEPLAALRNHQSGFVRWCAEEAIRSIGN